MFSPQLKSIALAIAILTMGTTAWAGKTEEGHGCTTVRPFIQSEGRCWHSFKEDGEKPKNANEDKKSDSEKKIEHKKLSNLTTEEKQAILDDCNAAKINYTELKSIFKQEAALDQDCKEHGEYGKSDHLACVKDKRDEKDKKDHEDADKKFEEDKNEYDNDNKSYEFKNTEHSQDVNDHENVKKKEAEKEAKAENSCKNKSGHDKDKCKEDDKKKSDESESSDDKQRKEHDKDFDSRDAEFKKLDSEHSVKKKTFEDKQNKHDLDVKKRETELKHRDELRSKHEEACKDEHESKKHDRCISKQRAESLQAVSEEITNTCPGSTHKLVGGGLPDPSANDPSSGGSKPTPVPLKSRESRQIFMR